MTRIFVGNLPHSASESEVRALFSKYGHVSSVQIKTDVATNRPRGFAFVLMPSMDEADEAIVRLSRASMNGRQLTINEAQQKDRGSEVGSGAGSNERRDAMRLFDALLAD